MEQPIDRRTLPPAAVVDRWLAPDGWSYRRMDWRQPAGSAPRGSLLFGGGRGDFIEKYLESYHHWHRRGWNVTAFDWRSQGGSRGEIVGGHLTSFDPLVDDLSALIAGWRAASPRPYVAIAHSMGGHVLLRTLAERQPEVDAAILSAPMVTINTAPLPYWAATWLASTRSFLGMAEEPWRHQRVPAPRAGSLRQRFLTSCADRYRDELWWWEREPGYNLGVPSWGWLDAAYRSSARLTPAQLANVAVPVLLLGTERDRLVSPAAIRRAASLIPGAELLMFEDAGHEILREADRVRGEALARIDAFLDLHAPAETR
jgi:lysophospholipase